MGPGITLSDQQREADDAPLTPLGEFMQRRNAELGLSVSAVALRVGISRATWYRIARGESASPGVRVLRGLARVYRVRAPELFALAACADWPSTASRARAVDPTGEPGDALWRCRYERQVRAGSWIELRLELLNLSDQPWLDAQVRGIHDAWLPLGDGDARPAKGCGEGRAQLVPTGPGDWVQTRLILQAPVGTGPWVFGLALYTQDSLLPLGAGALVVVEIT